MINKIKEGLHVICFTVITILILISSLFLDYLVIGDYSKNHIEINGNSMLRLIAYLILLYIFYWYRKHIFKEQYIMYNMNMLFIVFSIIRFIDEVYLHFMFDKTLSFLYFIIGFIYAIINLFNKKLKELTLIYTLIFIGLLVYFFTIPLSYFNQSIHNFLISYSISIIFYILLFITGYYLSQKISIKKSTHYYNILLLFILQIGSMLKIVLDNIFENTNSYYFIILALVLILTPILVKYFKKYDEVP